ncbi:MAG: inner membrane CreD family protein [Bacteroidales bacterium]|nr:inner membrane CreD family protein [Bacteroidales bacterium]
MVKDSKVKITSDWTAPSFIGAFLPDARKVNESGFSAEWNVLYLNRNYPQRWTGNQYSVDDSSFGVELLIPVDSYQKSMRSVKYAILFIALTFLVFLFAEIIHKIRIHPIHYLLTGLSLCIFFSWLTALS